MRAITTIFGLAAVSSAMAQVQSPLSIAQSFLGFLSPTCQATVLSLANLSSPIYQCLQVDSLIPAIITNGSIIAPFDAYLTTVCSEDPCSNALLNSAAQQVLTGCSSDLSNFGIGNSEVLEAFGLYPLAREVACLKTTEPMSFANASIPVNSTAYNSTNDTFCFTDLATDLSGYLGVNLTNSYLDTLAPGGNVTALRTLSSISPTALCSDCVYAALDLVYTEYLQLGSIPLNSQNVTLNTFLSGTCASQGFNATINGTLPDTIYLAAENSTFPEDIVAGNFTYMPGSSATADPSLNSSVLSAVTASSAPAAGVTARGEMAEKRRWLGRN